MKRKHKYVVYGLNPKFTDIVVLKTSDDPDYESFLKEFPNDECRWAVYDLEYDVEDGGKRNKVVFVYWCVPFLRYSPYSKLTESCDVGLLAAPLSSSAWSTLRRTTS